jgi:hypothetical protein
MWGMSKNNMNGNTINVSKGSKFQQGDININKKVENNIKVYKISQPKRMTKAKREKEQKKTDRPGLRDRENKLITCYGLVVCPYPYSDLFTVVNIVDKNGNYIADHIQLNFREDIYNYSGQIPTLDRYIRFTGLVGKYPKSDRDEFCVNITDKVDMTSSKIYYTEDIIDYEKIKINYKNIGNYLNKVNITKIYDLIDNIRDEINDITEVVLTKDFIFYYIVNQYFLNKATYNMYEGEFRDQSFPEECVLDILLILSHVLFDLKDNEVTDVYSLFELISYSCNIFQGIEKFIIKNSFDEYDAKYNDNPKFIKFCRDKLGCEGKRKLGNLWYNAKLRKLDFNMKNPVHPVLTKDMITYRAYHMLNSYIRP